MLPVMLPVIAKWASSEFIRSPGSDCRGGDRTPAAARHDTNLIGSVRLATNLICQPFATRFQRADNQRNDGDPVHAWATASSGRRAKCFETPGIGYLIISRWQRTYRVPRMHNRGPTDNRSSKMRVAAWDTVSRSINRSINVVRRRQGRLQKCCSLPAIPSSTSF
jgi:hypothetical protein